MTMETPPGFVPLFGLRKARVIHAPLIVMPVNADGNAAGSSPYLAFAGPG